MSGHETATGSERNMVCCKIITDFQNKDTFAKLLTVLSDYGDFLFTGDALYFANIDNDKTSIKTVRRLFTKHGYSNIFLYEYDKNSEPKEVEYINGWLYDKIIKINYIQCEKASQESFRNILQGLKILNEEIDNFQQEEDE